MIRTEQLTKIFRKGKRHITALAGIDLTIGKGEFVLVKGPSGSGKSTLLFLLGGLLLPTAGEVCLNGRRLYAMKDKTRSRYRGAHIGFVFQSYHLLPYLTVLQNILLAGGGRGGRRGEALRLVRQLGLEARLGHRPAELSAGEKQRVALARALITRPLVILADEPTGNLDPDNAAAVIHMLSECHRQGGTVVMVSHDDHAETAASRTLYLEQGKVIQA